MYLPSHFREERVPVLHELIRRCPLATIVMLGPEGLTANHIPMLVRPEPAPYGTLIGHVARSNAMWRSAGVETLAIFTGPDHYISPNWYVEKQEHGRVVPTWNYAAVHAHGTLIVHEDRDWLLDLVTTLTATHEAQFEQPWKVADAPPAYVERLLKGIVGIEIPIVRMEGKWKMGQNRSEADRAGAARGLREIGNPAATDVASLMEDS